MIYQVKDNKKIPLGTQFDNSWEIEYDRNLSSQLSGKSEWTATEDCWFQFNSIIYATGGNQSNVYAVLQLNGVTVSNTDGISDANNGVITMIHASVLMKKGDTIKYFNSETGNPMSFGTQGRYVKVFPIHRILSKDEGPVETLLWTNPDPTQEMPFTAIPVEDVMQYDKFRITWSVTTAEAAATAEIIILNGRAKHTDGGIYGQLFSTGGGQDTEITRKRVVTVGQISQQITFQGCSEVTIDKDSKVSLKINNSLCIPIQIFGIKERK